MRTTLTALLVAVVLGLTAGCGAGSGHDKADVTFASEMVPHHTQALRMVALTRGHDLDPDVAALVAGIEKSQSKEVATMSGWLRGWGEKVPTTIERPMNGMLSDTQLAQLADTSDDAAFQRLWLTRMTQHHRGAIPMARTEIAHGKDPRAIALAKDIVRTQERELQVMGGLIGQ